MDLKEKYREYLKSSDWKRKRSRKLQRKSRCAICGSQKRLHVHHLNYRRWTDVRQSDLRVLCSRCHETAHRLMDKGVLTFRTTDHHSRFALTKNAVKKALGIIWSGPAQTSVVQPWVLPERFVVTKEWLQRYRTFHGGWTEGQLEALDVSWPPPKKWQRAVIGKSITALARRTFECWRQPPEPTEDDKLFTWMNRL